MGLLRAEGTRRALRWTVLLLLPFVGLVRGAVAAHVHLGVPGWLSVLFGTALCAIALAALAERFASPLVGPTRRRRRAMMLAAPAALALTIYSVAWLSLSHAKSEAIAARWPKLHPALRLAVGTVRLADRRIVVTDIDRQRGDYARMGLPARRRSPHYAQPDGWVHAVDLRTLGRGELRNRLGQLYFELMGFDTLRHGGTGDHLHVAMPRR